MKNGRKKVWIGFFVLYQFFISFVINCGDDQAYDRTPTGQAAEDECQTSTFLTADCVEGVKAATVDLTAEDANDAEDAINDDEEIDEEIDIDDEDVDP